MSEIRTFLGANTPCGFYSLFDELYNPYKNDRAYLIKGGPGTGKSTFMKKVASAAENKGYETELVYCSSDPNSLDGVIVPELSLCIADATAPHVIEPKFPGACENIINMGMFWNESKLYKNREKIRALTIENSMCHRRSSRFLAAAGSVCEDSQKLLFELIDAEKVNAYAMRFAAKETPKKKNHAPGKIKRRFLSAVSPDGVIFFDGTVKALSSRVIGIDDKYSAVSPMLTEAIGKCAVQNGYDVIFCLCPLKHKNRCEHIIIPEVGLSVISMKAEHPISIVPDKVIHDVRFLDTLRLREHRSRLAFNRKVTDELVKESITFLKKAKAIHDELEKCYIESTDFKKMNDYADRFIKKVIK